MPSRPAPDLSILKRIESCRAFSQSMNPVGGGGARHIL
jgi:hypothetical protein